MIEVLGLHKRFVQRKGWIFGSARHEVLAVDGVHFHAADACITGLLGPNGAGKTTTLRVAAGLIDPDRGTVRVDGIDVQQQRALALARMGVLSDARGLYPRLSARENIVYFGRLQGMSRAAADSRARQLALLLDMQPLLDRRCEGFSQGERMKTALARALVHNPPNIVLDEPTNGLDVLATRALRQALRRLRDDEGKCIVFSSHIMQEVERLCDQVVVVSQGRTVAMGTVDELKRADAARRGAGAGAAADAVAGVAAGVATGVVGAAAANAPDFEDVFVRLAFPQAGSAPGDAERAGT